MKILLISSLFLSFGAFAIDFNKVTGTFDAGTEHKQDHVAQVTTFPRYTDGAKSNKARTPASVVEAASKPDQTQEGTGTFR